MKIVYIHYAFSDAGLAPAVAAKHASFAAGILAKRFQLPLDQVHVVHRPRLPETAPFQLSCYKGKSETCPIAQVYAAKLVLPHLRRAHRHTEQGPALIAAWAPGIEPALDDDVLETLAAGVELPADDARVQWLHTQVTAATVPSDKYARSAGGRYASGNRTRPALDLPDVADCPRNIGQLAAALLEHRRAEVLSLLAKGAAQ